MPKKYKILQTIFIKFVTNARNIDARLMHSFKNPSDESPKFAIVVSIVWVDSRVSREIRILYKWYSVLATLPINNNATYP